MAVTLPIYQQESGDLSAGLLQIIKEANIRPVFQSIVSLRDGSVLGYEALSRGPKGTPLESPEMLFDMADQCGVLWELELLCRSKALAALQSFQVDANIFLNVNPNTIQDEKFTEGFTKEYLKKYSINPENVIFEITEKSAIENMAEFQNTIRHYKDQNYKIAIDDAGAGYSGLNLISDIGPHYLKLDMNLILGIDQDNVKQALIKSMYEFSKITGTILIAEGIETAGELQTLVNIGVHYGQGYFIQAPSPRISPIGENVKNALIDFNAK